MHGLADAKTWVFSPISVYLDPVPTSQIAEERGHNQPASSLDDLRRQLETRLVWPGGF